MVKLTTIALVATMGLAANAGNISQSSATSFKSEASTSVGNKSKLGALSALGYSEGDRVLASFEVSEGKVSHFSQEGSEFLNDELFDSTSDVISEGADWSNTQTGRSNASVSGQMGDVGPGSIDGGKAFSGTAVGGASGLVLSNTGEGYSTASKGSVRTVYSGARGSLVTSIDTSAQKLLVSVNGVQHSIQWSVNDYVTDPIQGSNVLMKTVWEGIHGSFQSTAKIMQTASVTIQDSADFTFASDYWPSAEGYKSDAPTGSLWIIFSRAYDVAGDSFNGSVDASTKTSSDQNLIYGSLAGSEIIFAAPLISAQASSGVAMGSVKSSDRSKGEIEFPDVGKKK